MSNFDPFNRPTAPSYSQAFQEASRQTGANAAAYRPQRVDPAQMRAQLAERLAAYRAQPVQAGGRRALPVGTPTTPYERVDAKTVYSQMMANYNQQLAAWNQQYADWQRQQAEAAAQRFDGGGFGGEGGGDGGSSGSSSSSDSAGGSPAGDGGGAMGGAMSRGGKVGHYSKGGMVCDSFSKLSRQLQKGRRK